MLLGFLGKLIVKHFRHNRDKHVRHPQIYFVGQAIQSWRLVEADLLQCITYFTLCNQALAVSRFWLLKVGKSTKQLRNSCIGRPGKRAKRSRKCTRKALRMSRFDLSTCPSEDLTDSIYRKGNLRNSSTRANALPFKASWGSLLSLDLTTKLL